MKQIFTILFSFSILITIIGQTPDPLILQVHEEAIPWSENAVYYFKVSNFDQITSFQFSITWDTLQLQYINVNTYGPTELNFDANNFYLNGFQQGFIAPIWIGENPFCRDLDDETTLMSFRFKNPGGLGKFDIGNSPFFIEVTNCNGIFPDVIFIDNHGGVTYVNGGVITKTDHQDSNLISIYPNPAADRIFLHLEKLTQIPEQAIFYNLQGKMIGQSIIQNQSLELPPNAIPGTYLMMLQKSGQTIAIKKVQIQK